MSAVLAPTELFVVGSGRSGTTIVLEAIDCLDEVASVPRLAGRWAPAVELASKLRRHGLGPSSWTRPSSECTALFAEAGLTQEFQAGLGRSVTASDASNLRMDKLQKRLTAVRRHSQVRTVVVKNTASCARVPILSQTFPSAPFLHVTRHPARVVMSLLKTDFWAGMNLWWDGRTTDQIAADEGISQERVAARHWSRQVATLVADLHSSPEIVQKVIRYEDFTNDPVGTLQDLDILGLRVEDTPVLRSRIVKLGIRADRPTSPVPSSVQQAIDEECREVAAKVGIVL